jgi:phenylalanyl-tRNA synthetase beta chain
MKVSFNWLKDYVKVKATPEQLAEQLTMAGLEVKKIERVSDDVIFEMEITTNRPDWLSHLGVARELHATTGNSFSLPPSKIKPPVEAERVFTIATPDRDLCPYYSAVLLEDVEWTKTETPAYMKNRLEVCGIRSINFIVDVTNYVLLECGQPLHAFDADLLNGDAISARRAKEGEKIAAIDGVVYPLIRNDLIIADLKRPIAIGGVMGGKNSEVSSNTKNILLESAFFTPASVRQTARRLQLASESSYRFERRADPAGVDSARERAVYLIAQHAKIGRLSRVFSGGKPPIRFLAISFAYPEVKKLLGTQIPQTKGKSYLMRLGLRVSGSGKKWSVKIPSFRSDLTRSCDLIEEIARLYGYDRIPETLPLAQPLEPRIDPLLKLEDEVHRLCTSLGFSEAITFSLVESTLFDKLKLFQNNRVRLVNPQNKELNLMRPSLISGLLASVQRNLYAGQSTAWLFEIGNRYLDEAGDKKLPHEERMLGLILSGESAGGWLDKKRSAGFYDLKGSVHELLKRIGIDSFEEGKSDDPIFQSGQGISVQAGGVELGSYGTLSDQVRNVYDVEKGVFYGEFSLERVLKLAKIKRTIKDIPKFPSSPRDLTLICGDDLKSGIIVKRIREMAGHLAAKIEVFDCFRGGQIPKGRKSLSFRISYQAEDRTLENEQVNKLHFSIIDDLNRSFGTELPKAKATS